MKKKILVITPDTPYAAYISRVMSSLAFLETDYSLHALDSLSLMPDVPNEEYYFLWADYLAQCIHEYDAFIGFSFGGVILQQCFSLFAEISKPIVLFSTPSFADKVLSEKLNQVISLCLSNQLDDALAFLYKQVYYPNLPPQLPANTGDKKEAAARMIYGLKRVLETDSRPILTESKVDHLHLIGEYSHLVNAGNVVMPSHGSLLTVPGSSMRVMEDNPNFCQQHIRKVLC